MITAEFPEYYVVTCYTPNSQDGLKRLDYRMQWEDAFRAYLKALETKKPVIFCGDLNVAHQEIDLKNPKTNWKNAGFSDEERAKFTELLEAGFVDTFRYFYPDQEGIYSWWSYRFSARAKNAGWRIDYFCVSESLIIVRWSWIFNRIDLVQYLTQGIAVCSDKSCVQVSAKEYAIYRLKNFVQILKCGCK